MTPTPKKPDDAGSPKAPQNPPGTKPKVQRRKSLKAKNPKSKVPRPLDLDRQCGVLVPPNMKPCTRAITCKGHSVFLKRAVEGRSASYDVLVSLHQNRGGKKDPSSKNLSGKPRPARGRSNSNKSTPFLDTSSSVSGPSLPELPPHEEVRVIMTAVNDYTRDPDLDTRGAAAERMHRTANNRREALLLQVLEETVPNQTS